MPKFDWLKQLAAIVFLFVLAFNFVGYRFLFSYLQNNSTAVLEKKLDKQDYNDGDLISIKTPLNLPYYSSSPDYERVSGSIKIDGIYYEYVQRRVYQDTLELLCLPNDAKTKLHEASNGIAKSSSDFQTTDQGKHGSSVLKISFPDLFHQADANLSIATSILSKNYFFSNNRLFLPGYSSNPDRPPQSMQFI